jgi:hypothetical protein
MGRSFFAALALICFLSETCPAFVCGFQVMNPVTHELDCIGLPATGYTLGSCLEIVSLSPPTVGWAVCGSTVTPSPTNDLLLEDGTYVLLEDGTKILLE